MKDTLIVGAGCFWCVEACFRLMDGVLDVKPGYMGGQDPNPTYEKVCTGTTGHAEVIQVVFDTDKISFEQLLTIFWLSHDPTQLNRQGSDVGTQYRSAIFYQNDLQLEIAKQQIKELTEQGAFELPIVTTLEKVDTFFPAEDYHNNYFNLNRDKPYCQFVIAPKVNKIINKFS